MQREVAVVAELADRACSMLLDIFTALALAVDGYPALATDQSWDQMISFLNDPWLRVK